MPKKSVQFKIAYYDETGKRRGKTFSAPTLREARMKAAEWEMNHKKKNGGSMTVLAAVSEYISLKEAVLSPVTVRQYKSIKETHIKDDPIACIELKDLTAPTVQAWVNTLVETCKPKTVKNCYGLLRAAIKMQAKGIDLDDVRLPQPVRYRGHTPGDQEVQQFIQHIKDRDQDLYIATLLAAFGPMRRSEICALTSSDIKGNAVTVHRSKIPGVDEEWVIKDTPKTDASNRTIIYPDFVAQELKQIKGPVVSCTPTAITKRFKREIKKAGLPDCRFHDLRHYGASIMHAIGVPDVYIIQRGGWSSDHVMKQIYRDAIDEESRRQTAVINTHFSDLVVKSVVKSSENTV